MLLRILIVGALAVGLMAAIRDGRVMRDAGLLSSCSPAVVNGKQDATLQSCSKGRLDGFPDLTNKACQAIYVREGYEYWRCQAPVVVSQSPRG